MKITTKLIGIVALAAAPAFLSGPASAESVAATQELKEECVQRYSGLLSKPVMKTPDACWRAVGYLFDDATVAKYAAKGATEKAAAESKSAQR